MPEPRELPACPECGAPEGSPCAAGCSSRGSSSPYPSGSEVGEAQRAIRLGDRVTAIEITVGPDGTETTAVAFEPICDEQMVRDYWQIMGPIPRWAGVDDETRAMSEHYLAAGEDLGGD